MSLDKLSGTMLQDNLLRSNVNLQIDTDLVYFDVVNRRLGINTTAPTAALTVNGNTTLGNTTFQNNTITATNANLILAANTSIIDASNSRITRIGTPIDNSDAVPKSYVDTVTGVLAPNLVISDGTVTSNVYLHNDTLRFLGTPSQITTAVTTDTVTFSIPNSVVIGSNLSVPQLYSTVVTSSQPYITSVGNLTYLNAAIANIASIGIHDNSITAPGLVLDVGATGIVSTTSHAAFALPAGGANARPSSANIGYTRWNTDDKVMESWDGGVWTTINYPPVYSILASDVFHPNVNQSDFTLSQASTTAGTLVSINGVIQTPFVAYTVIGTTLHFQETPLPTDIIEARTLTTARSANTGIVSDNTSVVTVSDHITATVNNTPQLLINSGNTTVYNNLVVGGTITSTGNFYTTSNHTISSNLSVGNNITLAGSITSTNYSINTAGNITTAGTISGGNISVGSITASNSITIANTAISTGSASSGNFGYPVDSFSTAIYRSAKYVVQHTSGSNYQCDEVLLVHDGATATAVVYGTVRTAGNLCAYSAAISGTTVTLYCNAVGSGTSVNFVKTSLHV